MRGRSTVIQAIAVKKTHNPNPPQKAKWKKKKLYEPLEDIFESLSFHTIS